MRSLRWAVVAALCLGFCSACAKSKGPQAGTNTNWLKACNAASDCGTQGDCLCGVCTLGCTNDSRCSEVGIQTSCTQLTQATCGASATGSACLPDCERDEDCDAIAAGVCRMGHCVPGLLSSTDASVDAGTGREDAGAEDSGFVTCAADMRPALVTCIVSTAIQNIGDQVGRRHVGLELLADVVELGTGKPPQNCFSAYDNVLGQGISDGSPQLDSARWIRVEDGAGQAALIGVIGPGFEWPIESGAALSVSYERTFSTFAPVLGRLELRTLAGPLVDWFGIAPSVPELQKPTELSIAQGPELCRASSNCIPLSTKHDLVVELAGEPGPVALSYGEQAVISDFTLTHGGVDQQVGASTCADAFIAWALASAWRTR
jgi:hypothetical protein